MSESKEIALQDDNPSQMMDKNPAENEKGRLSWESNGQRVFPAAFAMVEKTSESASSKNETMHTKK